MGTFLLTPFIRTLRVMIPPIFQSRCETAKSLPLSHSDHIHHYRSPLGGITMASDGTALKGLWFDGQRFFGSTLSPEHQETALPVFDRTDAWLDLYFSGKAPDFTPPLSLKATEFRRMIWELLLTIPYGQTITYGELANLAARKRGVSRMSAQAVGGAVGHNPISLIIPCHRVIGAGGSLTGYAAGLDRKARLLQMESEQGDGFAQQNCPPGKPILR